MNVPFDPLTPEERALAERLRRVQPSVEPSAALDARILAAAQAATPSQRSSKRRARWALIPGGLVTAMGTAAAFVLAVGLVWQLRPTPSPRVVRHGADEDGGFVAADVVATRRPALVAPPPPPPPAPESPADAAAAAESVAQAPAANAAAAAAAAATVRRAPAMRSPRAAARAEEPTIEVAAAPPPPPPPAPETSDEWQARDAQTGVAAEAKVASQRAESSANMAAPAAAAPPAPAAAPELDRVQVTGSRVRAVLPPLADDSRLDAAEWLQRIRARRDAGDTANAVESLARFRHAHPRVHVPDDLRALER